jgi:hypothetical protein
LRRADRRSVGANAGRAEAHLRPAGFNGPSADANERRVGANKRPVGDNERSVGDVAETECARNSLRNKDLWNIPNSGVRTPAVIGNRQRTSDK